ncbi:MAG: agmatine/peptidylarginine deiminase [Planctomycetia bacterium]
MAASSSTYRLPAEWEPHAATWLAWPHRQATWLGDFSVIPGVFAKVARLIARYEPVRVVAKGAVLAKAHELLDGVANVEFVDLPTNDSWMRDTGPVFVVPRELARDARSAAVCWGWNAWGGKYPPWDKDAALSRAIAARLGLAVIDGGLVLEGGGLETDGEGTLLVNHRCIEDPARNPGVSRTQIEEILCDRLGIDCVLWVGGELAGDDTDGHIDQLARFIAPGRVVAARQLDPLDPNHAALEANLERLRGLVDARGRKLDVIPIDIPSRFAFEGTQLPASHLNFYVGNGFVAVPVFLEATDDAALRALEACFPGRAIEPVVCTELVRGRGALHCITRDEPAAEEGVGLSK